MNRPREIRLGVLGLLGVLVLGVGIPVALVAFVGYPLPRSAPSHDWLTVSVSATLIINILACVVWLVWAHFVVCLLSEWRAIRHGRVPSDVPFGGGSQVLARRLVAAVILLAGVATAFPHSGGSGHRPRPPAVVGQAQVSQAQVSPAQVSPAQDAASVAPRVETRKAGEATKYYVVQPPHGRRYDSLWDIAERTMQDPMRYKEIFALNKDRTQADGRTLIDANLILPGWELRLPADASGPGVHTTPAAPPARSAPAGGDRNLPNGSDPGRLGHAVAADAAAHATTTAGQAPSGHGGLSDSTLFGGALMLAGVFVALRSRRGPYSAVEDDDALSLGADPGLAAQLDRALRELSLARTEQHRELPHPAVAWAGAEELTLNLAGGDVSDPPTPWVADHHGRSWTRSISDDSFGAGDLAGVAAPFPGLLSVGREADYELFVDFEQAPGLVSIGGDLARGRELATALAVQAATSLWSDGVRVTVVGFGDGGELSQIDPHAIGQVPHLAAALDRIEHDQRDVLALQRQLAIDGVLSGRQLRRSEAWQPRLIVLSGPPTPDEAERLQALTGSGRSNVVVLVVGETPAARWRFIVDDAGRVDLGVLGASAYAHRLTPAAIARLAALFTDAGQSRAPETRSVAELSPAAAAGALGALTREPRTLGPAVVTVSLLGPVGVEAPGPIDPAKRALATEIAVAVALHPDGAHDAVLRASIWPRGVSDDVYEAAMADVCAWLGAGPGGQSCLFHHAGRWYVSDAVRVDWHRLRELAAVASGPDELTALTSAVGLIRGEAFSAAPAGRYAWLAFARAGRDARVVATTVVRRVASTHTQQHRLNEAEQILRRGLALVPTSELLWRDLLTLSSWDGPGSPAAVAAEMYQTLKMHRAWAEPETDALVAQLSPERRPSTA